MPTTPEQKLDGWLSVTEVLDAFIPKGLLDWYLKTGKKEAKRLSTVAMKIGSRVDELIQQDLTTGVKITTKDPIEVLNCFSAWQKFKADYSPKIHAVQLQVKSHSDKLVGHIDLIMDERVVDIKCASSIKQNHWLQVAKYADMYKEGFLETAILRLDKSLGTYQYMTDEQAKVSNDGCIKVFNGLLRAYRYYNAPKGQEE